MTELADLSRRNDELLAAKDDDLAHIRELEGQVKEYKRKYEQAKTELRSAKGTRTRDYFPTWMLTSRCLQRLRSCSSSRPRLMTSSLLHEMAASWTFTSPVSSHPLTVF